MAAPSLVSLKVESLLFFSKPIEVAALHNNKHLLFDNPVYLDISSIFFLPEIKKSIKLNSIKAKSICE